MANVLIAVVTGLITAVVAALVLDDGPGLDPSVVIFGITGAVIGYLVPKSCTRR